MINKKVSIIFSLIVLILAIVYSINYSIVYKTIVSEFSLQATGIDDAGVNPNAVFILKTTAPLTPEVVQKYLKIAPEINFEVQKTHNAENTFAITPKENLQENRVYTFTIDKGPLASKDFSWAFQVKAPFAVTSFLPADRAIEVPVNTGIELYFNRDDIDHPENYIEISPLVEGAFKSQGNKVTFIPSAPLKEATIYTIKVKAGLKAWQRNYSSNDSLQNETIARFQTSRGYSENRQTVYFSRQFSEIELNKNPAFGVYLGAKNTTSVTATIYKFDSAQEYLDAVKNVQGNTSWARYYDTRNNQIPVSKQIFSGSLPVESSNYLSIVKYPQTLPTGFYAIALTTNDSQDISWFQVNPVASFEAQSNVKSLIWLKDISSEKSISGAQIFFDNQQIAQTGADGVALFTTPGELLRKEGEPYNYERKFFTAKLPTGDLIIPIETEYGSVAQLSQRDMWWKYISLNKNIYLPTDTLYFWAIEKMRDGQNSGDDVTVRLTDPYWQTTAENAVVYAEKKIKLSSFGTLTGDLSFSNLRPGTFELTFKQKDTIIGRQIVTVGSYSKPAYKMSVVPDKNAVFAGDTITFKVKAEFFDGTPVANIDVAYNCYASGGSYKGNLTLDTNGEGAFSIVPTYDSNYGTQSYAAINVKPTKAEEGEISANTFVSVFGSHIDNIVTEQRSGVNDIFTIKTRAVVIKDPLRSEPYWNSEDYLEDAVAGAQTKVDIQEVVYIKEQTGTNYDAINKTSYPVYNYRTEYHPVSSQTVIADQFGVTRISFVPGNEKTYKLVFTGSDGFGRQISDTRYVYGDSYFTSQGEGQVETQYNLRAEAYKNYKVGDPISLQLQSNRGAQLPASIGNFIFIIVNNGNLEYKIQDNGKYDSTFREKDIPNIGIWPGWFAGGGFHDSYLQNVSFDSNERRLNIAVTKDKTTYKPGDIVTIDVKVTDKNNHGVKAQVNLSALDEAVFSLRRDETDIVESLYQDIYSQLIVRTSNRSPYGGGGAEKGGGDGDDSPRSNIQEIALYKTIETDWNGSGHAQFKLPDNITSWRLTTQAVTDNLFAGKNTYFIPVSLPFFVDTTMNTNYLADDSLILRLRTFGVADVQGDINYAIESPTLPFKKIIKVGGSNVEVPLGKLISGNHDIAVKAGTNAFQDALTRSLKVVDSYFSQDTSDFYEGNSGLKIKNDATGYTTLVFSSYGKGQLYNQLESSSYQWGVRLDQKGSTVIAKNLLNTYFGEKNDIQNFPAEKYQSYNGGLQLLPYSSDDLEVSAIAVHLFDGNTFNSASLKKYFTDSLADKKADTSRIVRALYGLTAYNEPVLSKIQAVKNAGPLTLNDRVFVALSLDSIGAKEDARIYYQKYLLPHIKTTSTYAYLEDLSVDDTILTSSLLAALTSDLDDSISTKLALYAKDHYPTQTLSTFERLLYIKSALPKLDPQEVSFAYKTSGKSGTKTLNDGEVFSLTLSPQELASLDLSDIKGKLGITASYQKSVTPDSVKKDSNLTIRRSYFIDGRKTNEFNEGDLVQVSLDVDFNPNASIGDYQVIDYLPSGLRPVSSISDHYYSSYDTRIYPTEIDNQRTTFVFNKDHLLPITYYARVISKGNYKAEPAVLQSLENLASINISHEDSVIIK